MRFFVEPEKPDLCEANLKSGKNDRQGMQKKGKVIGTGALFIIGEFTAYRALNGGQSELSPYFCGGSGMSGQCRKINTIIFSKGLSVCLKKATRR